MRRVKVYGGLKRGRGKRQVRTIVAATSKSRAAGLLGQTLSTFNSSFSETSNAIELDVATSQPETVFQSSGVMCNDFVAVDLVFFNSKA